MACVNTHTASVKRRAAEAHRLRAADQSRCWTLLLAVLIVFLRWPVQAGLRSRSAARGVILSPIASALLVIYVAASSSDPTHRPVGLGISTDS